MSNEAPFKALTLPTDATPREVRARWRELCQGQIHPDQGGALEAFLDLKACYEKALSLSRGSRICTACRGRGKLPEQHGFMVTWIICGKCEGSGYYIEK